MKPKVNPRPSSGKKICRRFLTSLKKKKRKFDLRYMHKVIIGGKTYSLRHSELLKTARDTSIFRKTAIK